jgi:hypothetical protein
MWGKIMAPQWKLATRVFVWPIDFAKSLSLILKVLNTPFSR